MRTIKIILIISFFPLQLMLGQNNIDKISKYYSTYDKYKLIQKFKGLLETRIDSIKREYKTCNIELFDLHKDSSMLILSVYIANAESFKYTDNIYHYFQVDTNNTSLAYVNRKGDFYAHVYGDAFIDEYNNLDSKEAQNNYKAVFKNILEKKPNAILFCSQFNIKFKTFLFVSNSVVYVYRIDFRDFFELNEFINKFYQEATIQELSKMKDSFIRNEVIY